MKLAKSSPKLKRPRLLLRRVVGDSMLPTLKPGRVVVAASFLTPKPNDIVVISHEGKEKIKRLKEIKNNKFYVVGDNPSASTDSRSFGWLDKSHIVAKVII